MYRICIELHHKNIKKHTETHPCVRTCVVQHNAKASPQEDQNVGGCRGEGEECRRKHKNAAKSIKKIQKNGKMSKNELKNRKMSIVFFRMFENVNECRGSRGLFPKCQKRMQLGPSRGGHFAYSCVQDIQVKTVWIQMLFALVFMAALRALSLGKGIVQDALGGVRGQIRPVAQEKQEKHPLAHGVLGVHGGAPRPPVPYPSPIVSPYTSP